MMHIAPPFHAQLKEKRATSQLLHQNYLTLLNVTA